jgi:thioredoxin 1
MAFNGGARPRQLATVYANPRTDDMANLDSKLNALAFIALCYVGYLYIGQRLEPVAPPDDRWFQAAVVDQPTPVLVKFGAPWCGPCRMLDPELDKLAMSGRVNVVRIEVDQHRELAQHYGVQSIPRLLLFDHGNVLADRVGYVDYKQLQSWVDQHAD